MRYHLILAPSSSDAKEGGLTPIVMWHGMGDSCCLPFSMGRIKRVSTMFETLSIILINFKKLDYFLRIRNAYKYLTKYDFS